MGIFFSSITNYVQNFCNLHVDQAPIMYTRAKDYNPAGFVRKDVRAAWERSLKQMTASDYLTRELLLPIVNNRVKNFFASQKYTQCDLDNLLEKFPEWDERKIFDVHDLFQVFEVDGDGLIEIAEMCVGLDNLGDRTPIEARTGLLSQADDDGTGSIDFEEFLGIIYDLEVKRGGQHPLGRTFSEVDENVRYIRHMSIIQQIHAGSGTSSHTGGSLLEKCMYQLNNLKQQHAQRKFHLETSNSTLQLIY